MYDCCVQIVHQNTMRLSHVCTTIMSGTNPIAQIHELGMKHVDVRKSVSNMDDCSHTLGMSRWLNPSESNALAPIRFLSHLSDDIS